MKVNRNPFVISVVLASALISGCAMSTSGENDGKLPFDVEARDEPSMPAGELVKQVGAFDRVIGAYPPAYSSEEERRQIYEEWRSAVADARALQKQERGSEMSLWLLSELYRQGHNMDVAEVGVAAAKLVDACLKRFPKSTKCHFSAADYYLSIAPTPETTAKAQQSLTFLRKAFAPRYNVDVEHGWLTLFLTRHDEKAALKQADFFLAKFPNDRRRGEVLKMRSELAGQNK